MATQMTVWRPFADFGELRHRVEEMFREAGVGGDGTWTPSVDVLRRNGDVILRADLPGIALPAGVKPEDIQSTTKDGVLEVTIPLPDAETKSPVEIETKPKAD